MAEEAANVKVYLRLRPMDKLETSKRSKDCIELHQNPKLITVESPLLGTFDFTFDQVFDEYTSQAEVYKESLSRLPKRLLDGISSTVMAYGQTGSGKSYTMLGTPDSDPTTAGMIPRLVADLFQQMNEGPASHEYTIRCSYVEVYLEKTTDLLQPWREVSLDDQGFVGAAEVCCLDVNDVHALLARGNACRTQSATDPTMDSIRSHAIFTIRLQLSDRGGVLTSRLQMIDLAGSEQLGRKKENSATAMEGRMISASLASITTLIRNTLAEQGKLPSNKSPSNLPKLAQLLRPCFGGTIDTTILCTGSPSSYNIDESVHTFKFGHLARQVTNHCRPLTLNSYRARLVASEQRQERLTDFIKLMAQECMHLRGRQGGGFRNRELWNVIENTVTEGTTTLDSWNQDERIRELELQLEQQTTARAKLESVVRDAKSDITSLRSQNEGLQKETVRLKAELAEQKNENKSLVQRKQELDHEIRTCQFREKEAIVFLRQFRTFYFRLLKSKAAQGSGSTKDVANDVSKRVPGVADLSDLCDVDNLMVESGLLDKSELGTDTNVADYSGSEAARARSAEEAAKADKKLLDMIAQVVGPVNGAKSENSTSTQEFSVGQLAAFRQKLLQTPAGHLLLKDQQVLEEDLDGLTKRTATLQNSLDAEKAMVEALAARQGSMAKKAAQQEFTAMKQELERTKNDLHAIVWKMNELVSTTHTMDTKLSHREEHLHYLEEHLNELQSQNRILATDRREVEKRLLDDNTKLKTQVDGMAANLWQLGDPNTLPPWRVLVPYNGEKMDLSIAADVKKRLSLGNAEDEDIEQALQTMSTSGSN